MFCVQCGLKLDNGTQFCPCCGTKISTVSPSSEQRTAPEEPAHTIDLLLLGRQVQFPQSIEFYIGLRDAFQTLASEISSDFSIQFYSTYHSMDQFIQQFPKNFPALFAQATDLMNAILSKMGIFGVTQNELSQYTSEYCCNTFQVLQEIQVQYQQILNEQESMREYREVRKDSRGRIIGGGFGLRGAAKGIITAGAINATTGALHSLGNAIGNIGSAMSASSAKDRLFHGGISRHLALAIQEDILGVHYAALDLIAARTGEKSIRFTQKDQAQAEKIFDDLEQRRISPDQEADAVLQMLTTFPFDRDYYKLAVRLFPDRLEEFRGFADFFEHNIDQLYSEVKGVVDPAVQLLLEYQKEYIGLLTVDLELDPADVEPLSTDLEDMLFYFSGIFECLEEEGFYFLPADHEKGRSKLQNAKSSYARCGKEEPLILYDSTLGRSGKDGFLITDRHIYLKDGVQTVVLPIEQVLEDIDERRDDSNQCRYLYFGEHRIHLLHSGGIIELDLLGDFLELLLSMIVFLSMLRPKAELLSDALEWYLQLPPAKWSPPRAEPESMDEETPEEQAGSFKVCYCFECGAENDVGDRYCCNCGAELI